MVSTVHDSIVADCPGRYAEDLIQLATEVFADLPTNIKKCWGYTWETPLECETVVGYNMRDMRDIQKLYPRAWQVDIFYATMFVWKHLKVP